MQCDMLRLIFSLGLVGLVSCGSSGDGSGPGPQGSTPEASTGSADSGAMTDSSPTSDGPVSPSDSGAPGESGSPGDSGLGPTGDAAAGPGPYGSDGPYTVTTATFQVTSPTDTFTTTAYIPGNAGADPVVILSSGFEQRGAAYAPYASRLASWGVITFLRDDPGALSSLTAVNLAADVGYMATTWLATTNSDASSALRGKVDASKIGLAGHSRGGQVALLAGEGGAKGLIQGVFGLDPVDTATNGVEARATLSTIGVPLAFIGETTDSTGGVAGMPCAPAADNYLVLFQAAASPVVAITAVNADHTMFEDPASCTFCTLCTAGTASQPLVLATAVRYLTAFFARQLLGDSSVGATFAGAGAGQDVAAGIIQLQWK